MTKSLRYYYSFLNPAISGIVEKNAPVPSKRILIRRTQQISIFFWFLPFADTKKTITLRFWQKRKAIKRLLNMSWYAIFFYLGFYFYHNSSQHCYYMSQSKHFYL